jgi:hypothetical protein
MVDKAEAYFWAALLVGLAIGFGIGTIAWWFV